MWGVSRCGFIETSLGAIPLMYQPLLVLFNTFSAHPLPPPARTLTLIPASEERPGRKFCDNQKGMKLKFLKEFVHIDLMKFA